MICRGHFAPETKHSHTIWILRSKLRKLLGEEKRSCHTEGEKLREVHQLFEQVRQSVLVIFSLCLAMYSKMFDVLNYIHVHFLNDDNNSTSCFLSVISTQVYIITKPASGHLKFSLTSSHPRSVCHTSKRITQSASLNLLDLLLFWFLL